MRAEAEVIPAANESTRRIAIYKEAHGEELGSLCLLLAGWTRKKYGERANVQIPKSLMPELQGTELANARAVRLHLVRAKEMRFRPGFLRALNSLGTTVTNNLLEEVPSLLKPQTVQATEVEVELFRRTGETFVSLLLGEGDGEKARTEREDTLHSLESTAETPELGWTLHTPNLRIAYFEQETITRRERGLLKQFISAHLPMDVTVDSAKLPSYGNINLDNFRSLDMKVA